MERAGWLPNDDCCTSSAQNEPEGKVPGEVICCALASANYKVEDNRPPVLTAPLVVALLTSAADEPVEAVSYPEVSTIAQSPPELPAAWQFSFRTALPPRAPSLVS